MNRLLGLETEYGLYVEGKEASALVEEAREVVRAYPGKAVGCWDYQGEDPRCDMRGFRAAALTTNPQDARLDKPGEKPLPPDKDKCDRLLTNGARLYNDHGHPEYATPECTSLTQLVTCDRAGERIVQTCAKHRQAQAAGNKIVVYKNNTDFHGMSYGCHENYLVARNLPFENLLAGILPFLVTRQIYAGAGKVGVENTGWRGDRCHYQLSQRADFCDVEASVDTLHRRPIVNTRDEPHADAAKYRRFHVIVGDANMSQYATALKVGTTAVALSLLECGWIPGVQVNQPVKVIKAISRDESFRWEVELHGKKHSNAIEIQRNYLEAAFRELAGESQDTDWVLREWDSVLDQLSENPTLLTDRLDWVAKKSLLDSFTESEGAGGDDDVLQSIDLEYHNIDPESGLFCALEQEGRVRCLVKENAICEAMTVPSETSRALIRGTSVRKFPEALTRIQWEMLKFSQHGQTFSLDLGSLIDGLSAERQNAVAAAESVEELMEVLR